MEKHLITAGIAVIAALLVVAALNQTDSGVNGFMRKAA